MTRVVPEFAQDGSEVLLEIGSVGRQLATSFADLLKTIPGSPTAPKQLADTLRIDKALAFRLLAAVRPQDPLATAHVIPGPEPLERVVRAAGRKGVPADILRASSEAVACFRRLIKAHAGDRGSLDAIISASLPAARERYESEAKQLAYRGMRQLKGISAEVLVESHLLHPSTSDSRLLDYARALGYHGLRRVRPGSELRLPVSSITVPPVPGQEPPRSLDGNPVEDVRGVVLEQFCSGPPVELQVRRSGSNVNYMLDWGRAVGRGSQRDVVIAELRRSIIRRCRTADDPRKRTGPGAAMEVPTRAYVCDLVLHDEAFPGQEPRLRILELGEHGDADPNDESRDVNVLDVLERVEFLGRGIDRFRIAEVPDYLELLRHVCTKLGWDPQGFRCFRTRIEYPIFGSQVQLSFEVPIEGPDSV